MDLDSPVLGDKDYNDVVAQHWYRLITGHPVPVSFLRCNVFPSSGLGAVAQPEAGLPPQLHRAHLSVYQQMLDLSAPFVEQVIVLTQRTFGSRERSAGRLQVDLDVDSGLRISLPPPLTGWREEGRRLCRRLARRLLVSVPSLRVPLYFHRVVMAVPVLFAVLLLLVLLFLFL